MFCKYKPLEIVQSDPTRTQKGMELKLRDSWIAFAISKISRTLETRLYSQKRIKIRLLNHVQFLFDWMTLFIQLRIALGDNFWSHLKYNKLKMCRLDFVLIFRTLLLCEN